MNDAVHFLHSVLADGWEEAVEDSPVSILGGPATKGVAQKGERGVLVRAVSTILRAEHYSRLVRMQPQATFAQSRRDPLAHVSGLLLAETVDHKIITIAFERQTRELPGHPHVKRIVQKDIRQQRRNRRSLWGSAVPL